MLHERMEVVVIKGLVKTMEVYRMTDPGYVNRISIIKIVMTHEIVVQFVDFERPCTVSKYTPVLSLNK